MNITATRFATHIGTWLSIAALTGLLIAIGAAIGGGAMYLFVVLAVGMNLVGYWLSDKLALKASRARPLGPEQAPLLATHPPLGERIRRLRALDGSLVVALAA